MVKHDFWPPSQKNLCGEKAILKKLLYGGRGYVDANIDRLVESMKRGVFSNRSLIN